MRVDNDDTGCDNPHRGEHVRCPMSYSPTLMHEMVDTAHFLKVSESLANESQVRVCESCIFVLERYPNLAEGWLHLGYCGGPQDFSQT